MRTSALAFIVSLERLRLWAKCDERTDNRARLAKALLPFVEAGDWAAAEDCLFDMLGDARPGGYFYGMTAASKRRFADGIAVVLCDDVEHYDAFFKLLKEGGATGRTLTKPTPDA